jgi:hypothetical protein
VIPEASEREELTVNEATQQTLEFPMDNNIAKQAHIATKFLSDFEKTEVDDYDNIFFLCSNDVKIKPTKLERLVNNGFDDDEGYYRV